MVRVNTMLNYAFYVLYEISCVFGIQYPFQLWNMFFFISDHRGGINVDILFRHLMKANSMMTHAATQLSLHSNILVMNVIVNLPGDTDN